MPTLLVELYVHYGEQYAFLKTLKIELPYDPAIPLSGENSNLKIYWYLYVHSSTVHSSQDMEGM